MEIPNCAHSFFLTSTFHHLTPPSFNRTWFWRSWDRDSVSTSYLSSWRERTKYLALDFLSSFVYTWFVPTFRVKWRSYWVWLERSRWFYPKSLKHWYGLLNWLLWYLHIIFFSFLSFPFSSCRLWLLTIDFVSPAFSLVYVFSLVFSPFIPLFWKVPFIVPVPWLRLLLGLAGHTHHCFVLLYPNMPPFGSSPLCSDLWLYSVHLALPPLPFCVLYCFPSSLIGLEISKKQRDNRHAFLLATFYMLIIVSMVILFSMILNTYYDTLLLILILFFLYIYILPPYNTEWML